MMLNQNLQREIDLQPVSQDHDFLVVLVERLRKAADSEDGRVAFATEIRICLADELAQHLRNENQTLSNIKIEKWLMDALAEQHKQINDLVEQLIASPIERLEAEKFNLLANAINGHVLLNELEVLPLIQKRIGDNERSRVALLTSEIELGQSTSNRMSNGSEIETAT